MLIKLDVLTKLVDFNYQDFGFIFDISPGGNLKFERAPFKMSDEMIELLGGVKSEPFKWFVEYCIKAYLACRPYTDSFITLVSMMLDTGFPCFTKDTIFNLKERLAYERSEKEAANSFSMVIADSLSTISSATTWFYDVFQNLYVTNRMRFMMMTLIEI